MTDGIALGDVAVRPPVARPWPPGRPGVAVEPRGAAGSSDPPLFVADTVLAAAVAHACAFPAVEVAGLLAGFHGVDGTRTFVEVTAYIPATAAQGGPAHVVLTHEALAACERARAALDPALHVVGWMHSHPGYGVFCSDADRFAHTRFFPLPWQCALVVDPRVGALAFFRTAGDGVATCGFHVLHGTPHVAR